MEKPDTAAQLPEQMLTKIENLGVIHVSGEETIKYLQGQVTIDMQTLSDSQGLMGSHCDFKGKTWSIFYAAGNDSQVNLVAHNESITASLAELKKYGVFSKVDIEDHSQEMTFFGGYGEAVESYIQSVFADVPQTHLGVVSNPNGFVICIEQPVRRYLMVLAPSLEEALTEHFSGELSDPQVWELLDVQAGIANIQTGTSNEFVPQMMNLQAIDAISFEKGCYMGQEVVARTKFLGKNKRAAFILKGEQPGDLKAGDMLEMQIGENWRRGGTVLRTASLGKESWILAVLANDTEEGSVFRAKDNPQHTYDVLPLPYTL